MMQEKKIPLLQQKLLLFLLLVFPLEPSHFGVHVRLYPLMNMKLSFFFTDLVIVAIVIGFLFLPKEKWLSSFWSWPSRWLYLFYGMGIASLFVSHFPYGHEHTFRLLILLTKILLFSSLLFLVQEGGKTFLHQIIWVVALFAIVEACFALFCYFTQTCLDGKHLRLLSAVDMKTKSSFFLPQGSLWLGDHLLGIKRNSEEVLRAYGTFGHPNILGGYLVMALMFSYFLFFQMKKKQGQLLLALAIFLELLALFVTYSRAALFVWGGITLLFFLLFFTWGKGKSFSDQKKGFQLMGLLFISLFLSLILFGEQYFYRSEMSEMGDHLRVEAQTIASGLIKEYPFFGVGLENFPKAAFLFSGKEFVPMLHNVYLLIAAEEGLCALLFFCGFLFSIFFLLKKKELSLETLVLLMSFLGFLMLGLCDFYPMTLEGGMIPLFALAALLTASMNIQKQCGVEEERIVALHER